MLYERRRLWLISIHAPLTRCDRYGADMGIHRNEFQSTHLLRGATKVKIGRGVTSLFQSTHLLRGATALYTYLSRGFLNFNPRTSYEVRPDTNEQEN